MNFVRLGAVTIERERERVRMGEAVGEWALPPSEARLS